jgi:DNA-binding SARP family transcriptional activator
MSWYPNHEEQLRVQVFGGPLLFRLGELVPLSSQKEAFLGFLFGNGEEILGRSQVLGLLWPDEDPSKARKCLSQLLYSLRKDIGNPPVFWTRGDDICWSGIRVTTDLRQFELDLSDGMLLACVQRLEMGFLERVTRTTSRPLLNWIESREAELRRGLKVRSERVWMTGVQEEDWERARMAAEALLRLFPLDEKRLQQVLESRARTGPPEEADEAAEEFRSRFEKTHGHPWQPRPRTRALLKEIRSLEPLEALEPPDAGRGASAETPEPPLLGRSREKSLLRAKLRPIPPGYPTVSLVVGEAGIGKSRLLREALVGMALDGHRVFSAGLAEFEQMIPLNPLIEAFASPRVGDTIRGLDEPWRTVLFGVMPSHYAGEHPIPEAPHIQSGSVPRRLYEAFHQFLVSLVSEGPVILVLEDLHWADETSLSVLEFIIRRWDHGGLQIVISVRSEEAHRAPALMRFLESIRTAEGFMEISLGDLDEAHSEALIGHLSPEPLDAARTRFLRSLAGGNPFFLIELTLEFLAGRLEQEVPSAEDLVSIPFSILQVLRRRLSQLSKDAERVLETLAVHNKVVKVTELPLLARQQADLCVVGIEQLRKLRMVVEEGAQTRIRHELIRQTVYQEMSQSRKAFLHRRVAHFLLRNRANPPPDELAVHFHRAGDATEAANYSIEAADRAEASGAFPEALRFLSIAREHSRDPEEVAALIGRMGRLNYLQKDFDKAAPLLELAAQRFRRQGKILEALQAEVDHIDCLARNGQIPHQDCLEELHRLKEEAIQNEGWEIFQDALDVEVHQHDRKGDLVGVRSVLRQASESAEMGGAKARAKAQAMLALNIYFGDPHEAMAAARWAVAIAQTIKDDELYLHTLNRLLLVLHYQGMLHSTEGDFVLQEAELRLANCEDFLRKYHIRLNQAVWHLEMGDLARAGRAFEAVEVLARKTADRDAVTMLQINLGELALISNDPYSARERYNAARNLLSASSKWYFKTLINAGLGLNALHEGHLAEARRMEAELNDLPEFWTFDPTIVCTFKARMMLKRRDLEGSIDLLQSVRDAIRERLLPAWLRLTSEQCRVLKRTHPDRAKEIAEEGRDSARRLILDHWVHLFENVLG